MRSAFGVCRSTSTVLGGELFNQQAGVWLAPACWLSVIAFAFNQHGVELCVSFNQHGVEPAGRGV